VQDVLGTGPLVAGFALATLTLGWPVSASQSGRLYLRIGFRGCATIGVGAVLAGSALLLLLGPGSSVWQVAATCFLIGLGMGLTASPTLIAAQSSVGWAERGVVTANNIFLRSLGSSLGVAVFGAMANAALGPAAAALNGGHPPAGPLTAAVHRVFIGVLVIAALMVVAVRALPRGAVAPAAPTESAEDGYAAA
jgi:MFS family permease